MSREESARAVLRSLASPTMTKPNQFEEGGGGGAGMNNHNNIHHSQTYPHPYSIPQGSSSASSQPCFFGNGSDSQILMDSPTSSPSLAALQSPPSSYRDSFGGTGAGRQALLSHGKLLRDGSTGTSGTNDVPSLSLSNSSVSDSNLLSPYYETPYSQNHSISSIRTVKGNTESTLESNQARRLEAIRRAAASMRIPVEEVQRGMEFVDKMMAKQVEEAQLASLDDVDREALRRISETVRSEEDRLTQIASFRAAYMQVESTRPEMELHHAQSPSSRRSSQQDAYHTQMRRRGNREGIIGMPHSSKTMPPLSPPPAYEQLEMLEYDDEEGHRHHNHHHSMPPAPRDSNIIPSPRAALESLTNGQRNHHYAYDGQRYSAYPSSSQHTRRPSGSRPLSLPDRSYRSMDDYVTDPLRNGTGTSGHLRRSMQAPYPPPSSISRNSSRSPLIGESPRLSGGWEIHSPLPNSSEYGGQQQHPASSPLLNTSNRLTPGSHGPHRQRSGSNTSNRSSILSRRTSGDVLGLGIPRSTSPAASISQEYSPPKLSHEEVLARLQKKVKERIAAREAQGGATAKRHSTPASTPTSPAFSLNTVNGGGRRRQGSIANSIGTPSAAGNGGSLPRQRKPRKAISMKSLGPGKYELNGDEKPLPSLPKNGQENDAISEDEKDDDPMSGVEQEFDPTASEGRLGIEALLSAAAIADSRA